MAGAAPLAAATTVPGTDVVVVSALVAVVLTIAMWPVTEFVVTMVHEGGHAVLFVLGGRKVRHVRIERDRTGGTAPDRRPEYLDFVIAATAGYTAPSIFGFAAALALAHGRADVVLWGSVALLLLLLTAARSWVAVVVILGVGSLLLAGARADSGTTQVAAAATWTWLLLMGGLVDNVRTWSDGDDHGVLQDLTLLPPVVWALLFTALAAVALGWGGMLLLGLAEPPI